MKIIKAGFVLFLSLSKMIIAEEIALQSNREHLQESGMSDAAWQALSEFVSFKAITPLDNVVIKKPSKEYAQGYVSSQSGSEITVILKGVARVGDRVFVKKSVKQPSHEEKNEALLHVTQVGDVKKRGASYFVIRDYVLESLPPQKEADFYSANGDKLATVLMPFDENSPDLILKEFKKYLDPSAPRPQPTHYQLLSTKVIDVEADYLEKGHYTETDTGIREIQFLDKNGKVIDSYSINMEHHFISSILNTEIDMVVTRNVIHQKSPKVKSEHRYIVSYSDFDNNLKKLADFPLDLSKVERLTGSKTLEEFADSYPSLEY